MDLSLFRSGRLTDAAPFRAAPAPNGGWRFPDDAVEGFETLAEAGGFRVERIFSNPSDAPGAWYDQDHPEWVLVVRGEAVVTLVDPARCCPLTDGEWLWLPARRRHRVERVTRPTLWLAIHGAPPR